MSVPVVEWWRVRVKVATESQPAELVRVSWYWPLVTSHWSRQKRLSQAVAAVSEWELAWRVRVKVITESQPAVLAMVF